MFKRLTTLSLCAMISFACISAHADEIIIPDSPKPSLNEPDPGAAISPMKKNQKAPFTGVLMSPRAVATIMTQINHFSDQLKIENDKVRADVIAQCDYKLAQQKNTLETDKNVLQVQLDARQKEILAAQLAAKKVSDDRPNVTLWTTLGAVGGIVLSTITIFAVSYAK